jgi:hypothetical protein
MNTIHKPPARSCKFDFNSITQSTPLYSKQYCPFRFLDQNLYEFIANACYMPRPIMFAEAQKYAIFCDLLQHPSAHMLSALPSITHNSRPLSVRVTETDTTCIFYYWCGNPMLLLHTKLKVKHGCITDWHNGTAGYVQFLLHLNAIHHSPSPSKLAPR